MLSSPIRQQVYQTIEKLPARGLEDLVEFLDYLSFRYKVKDFRIECRLGRVMERCRLRRNRR